MQQLDIQDLRKQLNDLCNDLNDKYGINGGACCFVAAVIGNNLDKLGIEYNLAISSSETTNDEELMDDIQDLLNGYNNDYYTREHYSISIPNIGTINDYEFEGSKTYIMENIHTKDIKKIYRFGDWNPQYKKYNNKFIKREIDNFFLNYKNSLFNNQK